MKFWHSKTTYNHNLGEGAISKEWSRLFQLTHCSYGTPAFKNYGKEILRSFGIQKPLTIIIWVRVPYRKYGQDFSSLLIVAMAPQPLKIVVRRSYEVLAFKNHLQS
jgi:hypothetical protein